MADPLPPGTAYKYDKLFEVCRDVRKGFGRYKCSLLVMPRDNYKLSFDLNDDGNGYVVSLVPDVTLRERLSRISLHVRPYQKLFWRAEPSEEDIPFSFIVDETFATIIDNTRRNEFHTQVRSLLHAGGFLFCFLPMESIASFFNLFLQGWIIQIKPLESQCQLSADVLIMAIKTNPLLAFHVFYSDEDLVSEELSRVINDENNRRKNFCGQISEDFDLLEMWADFEKKIQRVEEDTMSIVFRLEFQMISKSNHFLITLNDLKKPIKEYQVIVFYIPHAIQKGNEILKRENHRFLTELISPSSSICRFLVVCPGEGVEEKSAPEVKNLLGKVLWVLTPLRFRGTSHNTVVQVLTKKRLKPAIKAMKRHSSLSSPPSFPTPLSPVASSSTPQIDKETFPTTSGPPHHPELYQSPPDSSHAAETVSSVEEPKETSFQRAFGSYVQQTSCECSLKMWMSRTEIRWSKLLEKWNDPDSRKMNKTSSIPNWDARRPTKECIEVIHGIVDALVDMKFKGFVHGNLDDLDNYRLSFGCEKKVVTVHFVNSLEEKFDSEGNTADHDVMQVMEVIFQKILGGVALPRVWQSLYDKMSELATEDLYTTMRNEEFFFRLVKIKDHFSFWDWTETVAFYNRLWSTLHFVLNYVEEEDTSEIVAEFMADERLYDQARYVINSLNHNYGMDSSNWYDVIPKDSPWERFLRANGYGRSAYHQLRYIRCLLQHFGEKVRGHKALKYIKADEITEATCPRYVEMVVCESFFPFLESCFLYMHEFLQTVAD